MKKAILMGLALSLISNISHATPAPPEVCPSTSAIKNVPITVSVQLGNYYGASTDSYGTDNLWMFVMGPYEAEGEQDAIKKGNRLIQSLAGNPTPQPNEPFGWACEYRLLGTYSAIALFGGATNHSFSKSAIIKYVASKQFK